MGCAGRWPDSLEAETAIRIAVVIVRSAGATISSFPLWRHPNAAIPATVMLTADKSVPMTTEDRDTLRELA